MNSCELVTYISSVACVLSRNCSQEELELLAAIFSQLGDTLATILVNEANLSSCCKTDRGADSSSSCSADGIFED